MANLALNCVVLTLLVFHKIQISTSLSSGAPASTCGSMKPSHGVEPQTRHSPFTIDLSSQQVKGGETIEVILSGPEFAGFLALGTKETIVSASGTIVVPREGEGPILNIVNCPEGDGVTHSENEPKSTVKFQWRAPFTPGKYVILVTFVQTKLVYWLKQRSLPIEVIQGDGEPEPAPAPQLPGEPSSEEVKTKMNDLYKNCESTKGCFGVPSNCIQTQNCQMFASWRVEGDKYRFEIAGKIPGKQPLQGHVSLGLSLDNLMGQDIVVGCVYRDSDHAQPKSFYNGLTKDDGGIGFADSTVGLFERSGRHIDGWVFCNYTRKPTFVQPELPPFDLINTKYYMLLARSAKMEINGAVDRLGSHDFTPFVDYAVSNEATFVSDRRSLGAASNLLIQLHGAIMVIAWVMTSSIGIFVARYYKQTHTTLKPLSKPFWFFLHVGGMLVTIGLTFIGVILIFVKIEGYSENINKPAGKAHPILGLVLTGICCFQLIIGLLRPHPGTRNRLFFNWVHWTAGNIGHIVGVACIFLVTELEKAKVQSLGWLITVILFVVFHVVMHGILSIHTVWADKQMHSANKLRGITMGPMKLSKDEEAPGTWFRTFLLILYISGLFLIAIALITQLIKTNDL